MFNVWSKERFEKKLRELSGIFSKDSHGDLQCQLVNRLSYKNTHFEENHVAQSDAQLADRVLRSQGETSASTFQTMDDACDAIQTVIEENMDSLYRQYLKQCRNYENGRKTSNIVIRGQILFDEDPFKGYCMKDGKLKEFTGDEVVVVFKFNPDNIDMVRNFGGMALETAYIGIGEIQYDKSTLDVLKRTSYYNSRTPMEKAYLELQNTPEFPLSISYQRVFDETGDSHGVITAAAENGFKIRISENEREKILGHYIDRPAVTAELVGNGNTSVYNLRLPERMQQAEKAFPKMTKWMEYVWNKWQQNENAKDRTGILYKTEFQKMKRPDHEIMEKRNPMFIQGVDFSGNVRLSAIQKIDLDLVDERQAGIIAKRIHSIEQHHSNAKKPLMINQEFLGKAEWIADGRPVPVQREEVQQDKTQERGRQKTNQKTSSGHMHGD